MKTSILASFAVSLVTLGLTACQRHRAIFVETSTLVEFPAAREGDRLVFPVPSSGNKKLQVRFAKDASPCIKDPVLTKGGKQFECTVKAGIPNATRFYFSIDESDKPTPASMGSGGKPHSVAMTSTKSANLASASPKPAVTTASGKCPPWRCSGMVVVSSGSQTPDFDSAKSGSTAADEVVIYYSPDADGTPRPAGYVATPPTQGQPVTWVTNGVDKYGWDVEFNDLICHEGKKIHADAGKREYCNLLDDVSATDHIYKITVNHVTGVESHLQVMAAPTPAAP